MDANIKDIRTAYTNIDVLHRIHEYHIVQDVYYIFFGYTVVKYIRTSFQIAARLGGNVFSIYNILPRHIILPQEKKTGDGVTVTYVQQESSKTHV